MIIGRARAGTFLKSYMITRSSVSEVMVWVGGGEGLEEEDLPCNMKPIFCVLQC